jgi:glycerate dehydrogenase
MRDVSFCQEFHSSSCAGFIPLRRQVHQLLFSKLVNSDIVVTNSPEVQGPVVAEHVMALIFALAKKIPRAGRLQQKHSWGQEVIWNEGPRRREIAGSTLGLTGVGSIGRRVARLASVVGISVIAVREQVERGRPEGVQAVFAPSALDEMLRQCDFVVPAASLIAATHGLINADRLAVMKPGACWIHVGRGRRLTRPLWSKHYVRGALRVRRLMGLNASHCRRNPRHGVFGTCCLRRIRQALPTSSGTVTASCCPTICGATWSISGYPL